jgi:excisionase family DNA binding protein
MSSERNLLDSVLDDEEMQLAKAAQRCIVGALDHSRAVRIAVISDDIERLNDETPTLRLPPKVLRLFADMLGFLSQGKPVAVIPKELELTTQQAAMFLNVSRPHLIKMLNEGAIAYHKVGSHRKIRFEDVQRYKAEQRKVSLEALQRLADQAQELEMGY